MGRSALRIVRLRVEALLSFHLFCLYQYILLLFLASWFLVCPRVATSHVYGYWLIVVIYVYKECQDVYPTSSVDSFQASQL